MARETTVESTISDTAMHYLFFHRHLDPIISPQFGRTLESMCATLRLTPTATTVKTIYLLHPSGKLELSFDRHTESTAKHLTVNSISISASPVHTAKQNSYWRFGTSVVRQFTSFQCSLRWYLCSRKAHKMCTTPRWRLVLTSGTSKS